MSAPSLFRFGVFELDGRTGELRKHGVRLKIQDQPFQVLQVLLERPGELVSREELQSKIWAHDTFVDFDQSLNRAINKVREALGDAAGAPRFIETLPRRGYRFIAPVESPAEPGPIEAAPRPLPPQTANAPRSYRRLGWVAACLLAIAGASLWLIRDRGALPPPRVIPLTTYTGSELHPAFSPDGKQVAFSWNSEKQDQGEVYVKLVGNVEALRLTSAPGHDWLPSWSPDGRWIAFANALGGIFKVSPVGGPVRKLADFKTGSRPSWTADGKYLIVSRLYREAQPENGDGALFLVPAESDGVPREILVPPPGTWYQDHAVAPDGRSLAISTCTGVKATPSCTLQIAELRPGPVIAGQPREITKKPGGFIGIAWSADGSSLIYGGGLSGAGHLWRVDVRKTTPPERLEFAGIARYPAIALRGGRLAFTRSPDFDDDIWRLELHGKPAPFITSSRIDGSPQYSPDGQRIAFSSGREGDRVAIWVANADRTGLNQTTRIASPRCGTPRWSQDGKWIAFQASGKAGGWDVWVVEASGGAPRQLTNGPADSTMPSWSRDGSSVYFASKRSGRFEVWRVPAQGGRAEQVTRNGGYVSFESVDGRTLYYTVSEAGVEGLYAKSLPKGDEKQVVKEEVAARGFAVFSDGVYYLHGRGPAISEIRFYEFASGRVQVIGEIEGRLDEDLAVSPDRKTFLFSKQVRSTSDLMLVENFR
jgi:Tol biopolymer transport system component/DNA-binding winged helix-turn-helix (wHTH) protein